MDLVAFDINSGWASIMMLTYSDYAESDEYSNEFAQIIEMEYRWKCHIASLDYKRE